MSDITRVEGTPIPVVEPQENTDESSTKGLLLTSSEAKKTQMTPSWVTQKETTNNSDVIELHILNIE